MEYDQYYLYVRYLIEPLSLEKVKTYPTIPPKEMEIKERPQERLLRLGASALSESELLAMIFISRTKGTNVLVLAKKILESSKIICIELLDLMIIRKKSIDPMQKGYNSF